MISILFGPNRVLEFVSQKTTLRTNKEIFNTHQIQPQFVSFFLRVFPPQQHSNKTPLHHTSLGDLDEKSPKAYGPTTKNGGIWKGTYWICTKWSKKWLPPNPPHIYQIEKLRALQGCRHWWINSPIFWMALKKFYVFFFHNGFLWGRRVSLELSRAARFFRVSSPDAVSYPWVSTDTSPDFWWWNLYGKSRGLWNGNHFGGIKFIQMYGDFEGFPENNNALFGLVF